MGDMIRLSFCNMTLTLEWIMDDAGREWRQRSYEEAVAYKSPNQSRGWLG